MRERNSKEKDERGRGKKKGTEKEEKNERERGIRKLKGIVHNFFIFGQISYFE